jgi:membrane protease YdiL (CAAX protease family)
MTKSGSIAWRVGAMWLAVVGIWLFLGWIRDAVWGSGHAGYTLGGHMLSAALWTIAVGTVPIDRIAMFFFMGLVLGMLRVVTGSVWASIGLHAAFQSVAQLLLNGPRGHFAITGVETLQLVALGIVPFSLAVSIAEVFYKGPHGWMERAGRPVVS